MPEDAPKNKDADSPWPSWSRVQEAMETTKDAVTTVAPHGYMGYDEESGRPSPRLLALADNPSRGNERKRSWSELSIQITLL